MSRKNDSRQAISARKLTRWAEHADSDGLEISALHTAAFENRVEKVRELIKAGVDVNKIDARGFIPLHDAAMQGHTEIVKLLLIAGGAMDAQDAKEGYTPLMDAAREHHKKTVALLLAAGANTAIKNKYGETARDIAKNNHLKDIADLIDAAETVH